jgi:hypothetical protein
VMGRRSGEFWGCWRKSSMGWVIEDGGWKKLTNHCNAHAKTPHETAYGFHVGQEKSIHSLKSRPYLCETATIRMISSQP